MTKGQKNEARHNAVPSRLKKDCTNYLSPPSTLSPHYETVANYVRTMVSFGIISLFVMAMGCGFSVYTFRNPRYMFKRLAAGIHFISTLCTFIVVQVSMSVVEHLKNNIVHMYPKEASHHNDSTIHEYTSDGSSLDTDDTFEEGGAGFDPDYGRYCTLNLN
ncbi:hypothetical protein EVAR_59324_1 [Eumeta japonica]|uniref:Uncharacterized protein n=1 Tax=Eumeta variegata TaxID=151549 RepID=A0A4C1YMC7_EUMVA|nr:hypothetical protein EVAR_59324_1 [Eumeta japonica]